MIGGCVCRVWVFGFYVFSFFRRLSISSAPLDCENWWFQLWLQKAFSREESSDEEGCCEEATGEEALAKTKPTKKGEGFSSPTVPVQTEPISTILCKEIVPFNPPEFVVRLEEVLNRASSQDEHVEEDKGVLASGSGTPGLVPSGAQSEDSHSVMQMLFLLHSIPRVLLLIQVSLHFLLLWILLLMMLLRKLLSLVSKHRVMSPLFLHLGVHRLCPIHPLFGVLISQIDSPKVCQEGLPVSLLLPHHLRVKGRRGSELWKLNLMLKCEILKMMQRLMLHWNLRKMLILLRRKRRCLRERLMLARVLLVVFLPRRRTPKSGGMKTRLMSLHPFQVMSNPLFFILRVLRNSGMMCVTETSLLKGLLTLNFLRSQV